MTLRVLLADDHALLREGLAMLIGREGDMEVVGQASDGLQALELAAAAKPDIVLLDISMPGLGGVEVAERLRQTCPRTRVIALTRHGDASYVRRLLGAGAAGYVLKKSAADSLIHAIRIVAQGGTYVEPGLAGPILERSFGQLHKAGAARDEHLSDREEDVLRSVAWGRSNKEIAADLGISIKTVESYKATAVEKLHLHSRREIVRYALSRGWLSEDSAPE